ncbi:NAD-dependent epimerase/dehydratase family protein [Bradyrhizobium canariense]|uniref:NAD-dependent epimerase n=1 Tax=Bradyrhizobium canariense TaxID=255045 RepID=A0A1X3G185_9BRAD|nr:SDR family oxidoreductase [Bradyrhizobium canariense]OSI72442.1 NAD-dependent epimerase [Bradyrhizobium canariense]OSI80880.1 NAD-dependent epimerase [Bradyrhizobium canariense]OSI93808.1 NAD-dependent epimerase [Bradyrhizobium canariense]OSI95039.1 NAD-dependent epimerase [Bradyrhizobium canariense]OSJ06834.1 NAD-dependent epimerase [Bradyrhizobium canariense]
MVNGSGRSKRILITGVAGYVGPTLIRHLRDKFPDSKLIGFDTGYFAHNLTGAKRSPESLLDGLHFGDIRNFPAELLEGVDAVVHLAAISNDPMGTKFEAVTESINAKASIALANKAEQRGVGSFVFASSCSIYGAAEGRPRRESDSLNPLTAYARSKVAMENALRETNSGKMTVTCLRFATACGMSDRLRLDLVLNDFVASALSVGEIAVLSDGTPWRPLIDVADMARVIEWAVGRSPEHGGRFLVVNAGSNKGNYQVRELAEAVAAHLPGTKVSINPGAPPDKRSYQVDFALFAELAPSNLPLRSLDQSIENLCVGLRGMGFSDREFRNSPLVRLKTLNQHIEEGRLSTDLQWR